MKKYIITLCVLIISFWAADQLKAQTAADAAAFFEKQDYLRAKEAYKNLSSKKSKDLLYSYRYGYSAYMLGEEDIALAQFEKSASKKHPMAYYYMAEIFFKNYRFEDAAGAYLDFEENMKTGDEMAASLSRKIAQAELGSRLIRRIEDVELIDSVVVNKADFLSHIRSAVEIGKLEMRDFFDDSGAVMKGIVYTSQRGDRMYCSQFVNGSFNLFSSNKLLDQWTEPEPITDLNSDANENFPFLMLDGVTLYFASDGDESLGGYDIFVSRFNSHTNSFLKPENIGMPFNSPYNDYMMVIDELNEVGWFVSDRFLSEGKVSVYQFVPRIEKKIVQSEDEKLLIAKAKISNFLPREGGFRYFDEVKSTGALSVQSIFIDDNLRYTDDKSFQSNVARNYYFQAEKLKEELEDARDALEILRRNYHIAAPAGKNELRAEILELEKTVRSNASQIEQLYKKMRIEELKSLK